MHSTKSSTNQPKTSYTEEKIKNKTSWMKEHRKMERNEELRRLYPPYYPSSNLEVFHVHYRSTVLTVEELIKKATKTTKFVVDTESQYKRLEKGETRTNGALIQIQMIHPTNNPTVVVIETYYLPDTQTTLYKKVKNLCDIIFNNNNEIITWGPIKQEFESFQHLNLIHLGNVRKCDLQFYFSNPSQIYDTHPEMERREITGAVSMEIGTAGDELIVHVEDDDWMFNDDYGDFQPKEKFNQPLGLQAAVAENFKKFLDKSYTKNEWNCGLDLNLDTWRSKRFSTGRYYDGYKEKQERKEMLKYAVHDCASVAELYFKKYPESTNYYSTPPETPSTTTTIVQTPRPDEVFDTYEHEAREQGQQSEQNHGKSLTKREIFLNRPELLYQMDENELIAFQRPALDEKKQQIQQTAKEELEKKKKQQRHRNEKYKVKKRDRPDFINPIIRPIYYLYDYKKIRAQLQENHVDHSHQLKINKRKSEVMINFKSEELKEEGKKKVRISYFSRTQYYERWGQ